eukprot:Protomagalhaensia_sp_Gyna_25__510@NODE_123_length_5070_cov_465_993838_g97_i0_p3_GENE_NODE_123_length_5070_cov_465_993838_g97_i0NODE_123_length_5070_cov_465_993838_g97_i0_p3_ORF_typecomplete_len230_score58_64BUD22/PF09073_10/0_0055TFIIF_alpha/PF05793_12/0_0087Astro_capsid_p/PF12226_8/0_022KCT2/PF17818_1/0_035SDA1/PF05285_12/0_055SURF2/PF05477_11/0_17CobT/PF06213_12/0_23Tim54/PF11711_8/0_44_NODE_123_length_5070_cov_465_993838_g97_i024513140
MKKSPDGGIFQLVADSVFASEALRGQLGSIYSHLKSRSCGSVNSGVIPEAVSALVAKVASVFAQPPDLAGLKAALELFYLMNEAAQETDRSVRALIQTTVRSIQLTLKGQGISPQELMGLALSNAACDDTHRAQHQQEAAGGKSEDDDDEEEEDLDAPSIDDQDDEEEGTSPKTLTSDSDENTQDESQDNSLLSELPTQVIQPIQPRDSFFAHRVCLLFAIDNQPVGCN